MSTPDPALPTGTVPPAGPPATAADVPARLLAALLARRDEWEPRIRFSAERRWYLPLPLDTADGVAEAWLLSWLPGQRTGLHDHGGAAGAFTVVRGTLREHVTSAPGRPHARLARVVRHAGQERRFGPHHLHDLANVSTEPAVSVHVYVPGLTRMTRYRWTTRGPVAVAVEQAGEDW